ncbi:hypothetical protein HMPREF0619_01700 [Parabacteroides sp. D13]|nr:hypothetical protein HMPREF0619_01700 [Parabacteroides sp. D13]
MSGPAFFPKGVVKSDPPAGKVSFIPAVACIQNRLWICLRQIPTMNL